MIHNYNHSPVVDLGYAHKAYAAALAEFGTPLVLPRSGGNLLKRPIRHTSSQDAMGPYPLFSCVDWNGLADDLEALRSDTVAVALAPDPFGDYPLDLLHKCFDRVIEFKAHFVVDRDRPYGIRHHRYYQRKALRDLTVDVCSPEELLPDWIRLYAHLIERHQLKGIKAFSPASFRQQFSVPGLVCVRARTSDGRCVGAHLWYVSGDVGYSHLAASDEVGYRLSASYAIYAAALEYLHQKVPVGRPGRWGRHRCLGQRLDEIQTRLGERHPDGVFLWTRAERAQVS